VKEAACDLLANSRAVVDAKEKKHERNLEGLRDAVAKLTKLDQSIGDKELADHLLSMAHSEELDESL
jgi:hypothetical protein